MNMQAPKYLTSRYGPMLINARQSSNKIEIAIDGPQMRIQGLQLMTSLSLIEGNELLALKSIAKDLEGVITCGHTTDTKLEIEIKSNLIGPFLALDVGPVGMYTSKMIINTKSRVSFRELLDRHFSIFAGNLGLSDDYIACFIVIPISDKDTHEHLKL